MYEDGGFVQKNSKIDGPYRDKYVLPYFSPAEEILYGRNIVYE